MLTAKKRIRWDFEKPVKLLKWDKVHTVCEESRCPNRYECSAEGIATYLIGGKVCTRACHFCHIDTGRPKQKVSEITAQEEADILSSVKALNNKYVVITSVARDDNEYELAQHFAHITSRLNEMNVEVELLIPDFHLKEDCLRLIADSEPLVLAHNIETVQRLSKQIRPQAGYERTLELYSFFHREYPNLILKAGMMVGLGENFEEIRKTLLDLRSRNVEIVTIGQYLRPSAQQAEVKEYLSPERFEELEMFCKEIGFIGYEVGPFVRSSYMASKTMKKVKQARKNYVI